MPTESLTINEVFAAIHTNSIVLPTAVELTDPPTPTVETVVPNLIDCPAFCAMVKSPAVAPITTKVEPTDAVAGSVSVVSATLLHM